MTAKDIVLEAIKERGYTQTILAEIAGFKYQSNIGGMLKSKNMRVDNFVRLLGAMGYEVIVKDKNSSNKTKWTLTGETEE